MLLLVPGRVLMAQPPPNAPATVQPTPTAALFSDADRSAIVAYWSTPGRYQIGAPSTATKNGPWRVQLTPEGSNWLWKYQHAVTGPGKSIPPTVDANAGSGSPWERWVTARVAYDRYLAGLTAAAANRAVLGAAASGQSIAAGVPAAATAAPTAAATLPTPPDPPGPIPPSLLAACGNPPPFAAAVTPFSYQVTFDDGEAFLYEDHPRMRDRYAYYRFAEGVVSGDSGGSHVTDMPPSVVHALFQRAGLTPSDERILSAVSALEGGFEAVQTYDTGFLSVGFIQFVTMDAGNAQTDFSHLLLREKTESPADFQTDFHRFGIDVQPMPDGSLTVLDPTTGAELVGHDAVLKVISDKRLTAVFQRAGRHSDAFRVAQIEEAHSSYWPADDPIKVTLADGTVVTGKVDDVIHSEAGMATLLDRKINTGHLGGLNDAVGRALAAHHGHQVSDAAPYERDIVASMRYRANFLTDATLGQPGAAAGPPPAMVASNSSVSPASVTTTAPGTPTLQGAAAAPDYEIHGDSDGSVTVPFRLVDDEALVSVQINGHSPLTFVLDTGAVNALTPEAARTLGLTLTGQVTGHGGGGEGSIEGRLTQVDQVDIGGAILKNQTFYVLPLPYDLTHALGEPVSGLIGYELLQRMAARIDYGAGTVRFDDGATFHYHGRGTAIPFVLRDRRPVIRGSIDGLEGTFQIDTGASGSLEIYSPFVTANSLVAHYDARYKGTVGQGLGGAETAYTVRTGKLDLGQGRHGTVEVKDLVTALSTDSVGSNAETQDAGAVGTGVLKRFTITLDYKHATIYLEKNRGYKDRDAFTRSGVRIDFTPQGLAVVDVLSGTPGEAAGIRAGDTIVAVNGVRASDLNEPRLHDMMDQPAGTIVHLRIRREGHERDADVALRDLL
jgi:hypothetical protein